MWNEELDSTLRMEKKGSRRLGFTQIFEWTFKNTNVRIPVGLQIQLCTGICWVYKLNHLDYNKGSIYYLRFISDSYKDFTRICQIWLVYLNYFASVRIGFYVVICPNVHF